MYITIEVMPTSEESLNPGDLDTIRCPDCQSLNFFHTEEGDAYCFECGTLFSGDNEVEAQQ